MSLPTTDAEVAAWVAARIAELDMTPRDRRWKTKALGMSIGDALAEMPRIARMCLKVPVGEMRIVRDVARARGLPTETLVRRAVATWLVACAEVPVEELPYFSRGGMIGR